MTEAAVWDDTQCALGEGAFWHPARQQFFWFDILGQRLYTREDDRQRHWQFDEYVSAAGWTDDTTLLIASATRLFTFDVESDAREDVHPLEADSPATRSNDGRADPWGGFWIGTMGRKEETGLGAIYRYYRGELRKLHDRISIPNAQCFAPDGSVAYWTDTRRAVIMRQPLDPADGWPSGDAAPWLDLHGHGFGPDGAVVDGDGNFWNAQWGAGRVAAYAPDGRFLRAVAAPALHTSCPAFGGPDLTTLFITSATHHLNAAQMAETRAQGATLAAPNIATGQAEHRVVL